MITLAGELAGWLAGAFALGFLLTLAASVTRIQVPRAAAVAAPAPVLRAQPGAPRVEEVERAESASGPETGDDVDEVDDVPVFPTLRGTDTAPSTEPSRALQDPEEAAWEDAATNWRDWASTLASGEDASDEPAARAQDWESEPWRADYHHEPLPEPEPFVPEYHDEPVEPEVLESPWPVRREEPEVWPTPRASVESEPAEEPSAEVEPQAEPEAVEPDVEREAAEPVVESAEPAVEVVAAAETVHVHEERAGMSRRRPPRRTRRETPLEAERLEAERLEAERLEAERLEAERLEAERLEAERLEAERLEAERLEAERLEAERLEAERLEAERKPAVVELSPGFDPSDPLSWFTETPTDAADSTDTAGEADESVPSWVSEARAALVDAARDRALADEPAEDDEVESEAAPYDPRAPFGPGSSLSPYDGSQPPGYPVKATLETMVFHLPGSRFYSRARADVWFDSEATAEAAGFVRSDRRGPTAHAALVRGPQDTPGA